MEQKSATPEGCPFTCPHVKGNLPKYSPDMCPRTEEIMLRTGFIGTEPDMSDEDLSEIAAKVNAGIA